MTTAKPLARYGAIGARSQAVSLPQSCTTTRDLTNNSRKWSERHSVGAHQ